MNIPSTLLSVLKHHGGQGADGDAIVQVPAFALPTLQIPVGLTETNPGVAIPSPQSSSVLSSFDFTVAASSGATTIPFLGLRPGLWRVEVFATLAMDFEPNQIFTQLTVAIQLPIGAVACPLMMIKSRAATTPVREQITRVLSLEREALITLTHGATGVGETINFVVSVLASRLL